MVGQLVDSAPGSTPNSIPQLLLSAKSVARGPYGDTLAKTAFIQRLNTVGGVAPAAETCNATTAGTQQEVPYTADYTFWRKKHFR